MGGEKKKLTKEERQRQRALKSQQAQGVSGETPRSSGDDDTTGKKKKEKKKGSSDGDDFDEATGKSAEKKKKKKKNKEDVDEMNEEPALIWDDEETLGMIETLTKLIDGGVEAFCEEARLNFFSKQTDKRLQTYIFTSALFHEDSQSSFSQ